MTSAKSVFEFRTYKTFLHSRVGPATARKGVKSALARALRCQPTYVSQILNGPADLSVEHAERTAEFFGMTAEETHFFILLVQRDRAGTQTLRRYFDRQISAILDQRMVLTKRLGGKNALQPADRSIYYSSWIYAAAHMALTIPELREPGRLARSLGVSKAKMAEVLAFLERAGLAERGASGFIATQAQIRIGTDSHHVQRLHANWRERAIESLDRETLADLHYSGVVSLSREDVSRLKERMLEFIGETVATIRESKEETLYSFCMDFFGVARAES